VFTLASFMGGITSAAIYRDVKDLRSAKKIVQQLL
jgi:hypothetical protein